MRRHLQELCTEVTLQLSRGYALRLASLSCVLSSSLIHPLQNSHILIGLSIGW